MELGLYKLSLPEYQAGPPEPNHEVIGKKMDDFLKKNFLGEHLAVRCISSRDHSGKTVDELVDIIQTTGTDRYNPDREGDRYENKEGKHIDFFAFDYTISQDSKIFCEFTWPFYHWEIEKAGRPLRIDIIILYYPDKLKQVFFTYKNREHEGERSDGWVFREPEKRADAVRGLVMIT